MTLNDILRPKFKTKLAAVRPKFNSKIAKMYNLSAFAGEAARSVSRLV